MGEEKNADQRVLDAPDILDAYKGFVGICTLDGTLVDVNGPPLETASLKRADVVGKALWETFWWSHAPDAQDRLERDFHQAVAEKQYVCSSRARIVTGRIAPVMISFNHVKAARTGREYMVAFAVNDSEKVHATEELAEQEQFARELVDAAPVLILRLDADRRIQHVNPHFEHVTGFCLDEIKGREWVETFVREGNRDTVAGLFDQAMTGELPQRQIRPFTTAGGKELEIEWTYRVLRDAANRSTGLLCIGQDVTDRQATQRALEESEATLAEAQQLAKMGSWQLDLDTDTLSWSDEVFRIFEVDPENFGASYEAFLNFVHPDDRDMVATAYTESLETRTPYNIEHRLLMPDGSIKFVAEHCATYYADDGTPIRSIGTVQDVTDRRLMEDELRVSKRRAEEASQAKSEFLSRMSHELRTPLNAIIGFTQILQMEHQGTETDAVTDHVAEISRAGAHLLDLVNEILELSKIEAGSLELNPEPVRLNDVLGEAMALVRPLAERKKIDVCGEEIWDDKTSVVADRTGLKQVLINLISNAIKYNKIGGSVTFATSRSEDGFVRLSVSDTGPGIPADRQKELFEPFNRLSADETGIEGTGIGLTICKRLTEMMGGRIGFESREGEGSCFWIEFEPAGAVPRGQSVPDEVIAAVPARPNRVLYVEDNPTNVRLMEAIFKNVPQSELMVAETGEAGLHLAREVRPDLVLMDIGLPGIDGFEALRRLRHDEETREIPVIAVSAHTLPEHIDAAREAGFEDYLTKPVDIRSFLGVLARYLGQSDAA